MTCTPLTSSTCLEGGIGFQAWSLFSIPARDVRIYVVDLSPARTHRGEDFHASSSARDTAGLSQWHPSPPWRHGDEDPQHAEWPPPEPHDGEDGEDPPVGHDPGPDGSEEATDPLATAAITLRLLISLRAPFGAEGGGGDAEPTLIVLSVHAHDVGAADRKTLDGDRLGGAGFKLLPLTGAGIGAGQAFGDQV